MRLQFPARLLLSLFLVTVSPLAAASRPSEPVSWLQSYLRIDTTNPPGREHLAAANLAAVFHREAISTQILVSPRGRANLLARLPAAHPLEGPLLLLHHLDVVPAGDGWSAPPFSGELRDGRLWGRGAVDAKSLGIAHLAAMVDLKRRKVPLRRDLLFLAVADEEEGGGEGTGWLWQRHPELFAGVAGVLNEGGQNRAVLGRLLWWGIEVAQKRPLWLEVRTHGRPGHASGLNPASAVHQLVKGLARLLERPPAWRVSPPARQFFAALAPYDANFKEIFLDLDRFIIPAGPLRDLLPGMPLYFLDTVQVTVLEGSNRINVVPATASARIDVRLLPDTDAAAFLVEVRQILGSDFEVKVLLEAPPVEPSPVAHEVYRHLATSLGTQAPVVPAFIPGITDSRFFRERGIPAYGFSPFRLELEALRGVHGPDEQIPVAEFERGVETMLRVVEALSSLHVPERSR